ncbi:hypothetical protein ACET3Z_015193 [Daucus carota]
MERIEPALVPEWLRCSGSVTGGGSSAHHFASSSDVNSSTLSVRNKAFRSINDKDSPRSSFLDRSGSSNSRRSSSSNGSSKHPYSSFTRSHRDKTRDREKERPAIRDLWDPDPLASILGSRVENTLRRSQSMVSRKNSEALPRKVSELKGGSSSNRSSDNGVLSGGSNMRGVQKVAFEKDFPSLGAEEKQVVSDVGRMTSPLISTAVQSLPIGTSGLIGGEGWTSALVEVPVVTGNSITGTISCQQSSVSSPASGVSSSMGALNMAETLTQAPLRVRTSTQLPDKIQRLEELAIKQSRQLIPMRPSTPKALVVNSSDKLKQQPKTVRTSETIAAVKIGQQQGLQSQSSQSLRAVQIKSDVPKTSHGGKFLVLKPVWENGVSSTAKDGSSISRVANSQVPVPPVAPAPPLSSPNHATIERKAIALNPKSIAEKRASLAQARSRNDFFNLMRKKNSLNTSGITPDSGPAVENPCVNKVVGSSPESPCVKTENGSKINSNGDSHEGHEFLNNVEKSSCLDEAVYPDEEEAAFLRSLGWEESSGEDEGLTEEEINAFYQEYMKLMPSLKICRGVQLKTAVLSESYGSK